MDQASTRSSIILNIVPITLSSDKFQIGRLRYEGDDAYQKLRNDYWKTHSFRFDARSNEILNVSLQPSTDPLGELEEVNVADHLLLIAKAIQQSILIWLAGSLQIIKAGKKLIFWGQADTALLLSKVIKEQGLQPTPGLEVPVRYEIDCRLFADSSDKPYLGLIIDIGTSNVIDIPLNELMNRGLNPVSRYVCRKRLEDQPYIRQGFNLIGRVSKIDGSVLLLTDTDGINEIDINEAFIEPRHENLEEVIRIIYGTKSEPIIRALKNYRQPFSSALGKLDKIKITLKQLKTRNIIISNGLQVNFGELFTEAHPSFPLKVATARPPLLMGPQGRNSNTLPDQGIITYGPYLYTQHIRNSPVIAVICEAPLKGRVEQFISSLRDGFPQEAWTDNKHTNPFQGGLIGKYRLSKVRYKVETVNGQSAQNYKDAIKRLLNQSPELPDLAIVQVRESNKELRGNDNPYFVAKSVFMKAGVPTQSICIEKIETDPYQLAYILNNISLAIYAKLDGIPWVIATRSSTAHEMVIGLDCASLFL